MVGSTGPAWCYCDVAGQLAGAVTLGAYPTLTPKQLAYISRSRGDTKIAFVEGIEEINKILARRDELTKLAKVIVWNTAGAESLIEAHDWLVPFERGTADAGRPSRYRSSRRGGRSEQHRDHRLYQRHYRPAQRRDDLAREHHVRHAGPRRGLRHRRRRCRAELPADGTRGRTCSRLLRAHQHGHGDVLRCQALPRFSKRSPK